MKQLAFDSVTVLSRLENLRDSVTDENKPPWPGDFVVSPVAALSIAPIGVTTPCKRIEEHHNCLVFNIGQGHPNLSPLFSMANIGKIH